VRFDGGSVVIAHGDFPRTRRVGKYGVDAAAIDRAVENVLKHDSAGLVHLIDEIGKMQCLSAAFVTLMSRLLDGEGTLVATVALRSDGL
jgi:nucleoside-triphosphatase